MQICACLFFKHNLIIRQPTLSAKSNTKKIKNLTYIAQFVYGRVKQDTPDS
jgi:hypothetical protein